MVDIGQASKSIVWHLYSTWALAWCRHHHRNLPETKGIYDHEISTTRYSRCIAPYSGSMHPCPTASYALS